MPNPTRTLVQAWKPQRLIGFGLAMMSAGYLAVFIADGAAPSVAVVRDALANTLAAAVTAIPVWWLCARMHWRLVNQWWFVPAHVAAAGLFAVLWYLSIALALSLALFVSGAGFRLNFLTGPALHWETVTATVLYFAIAAGCYLAQTAQDAQRALDLQHQSELRALRAQLDPHLLFNTLHSLLELVRSGDSRADEAIDRFARVARYVGDGRTANRDLVPLHDEWRMTQDYVALESLRLGSRLTCEFDYDTQLDSIAIPALSLQPLVENAIRHGVAPRPGAGVVRISARVIDRRLHLSVDDDGLGAMANTHGTGTGLNLVRRRLEAHFGDTVVFAAGPKLAGGWTVTASFPATMIA